MPSQAQWSLLRGDRRTVHHPEHTSKGNTGILCLERTHPFRPKRYVRNTKQQETYQKWIFNVCKDHHFTNHMINLL